MSVLHVLTPAAPHAPAALIRAEQLAAGDVIADLRRATPLAWRVAGQGELLDVTDELLPPADYWAVARDWLADLTARAGLAARLAVAGYSFWWPVDAKQFVPSFSDLGNLFAWIDLLAAVRDGFPPERIVVHGEHRAIRHLAGQLYGTTPIDRRAGSAAPGPPAVPQWTVLRAVRVLLGVAVLAGSLLRRPHALFLSTTNLLRARRVDGRERIGDVYLDDVAGALRARGWRTLFVENYAGRASWRNLRVRGLFFPDDVLWVLSHPRLAALGLNRRLVARWRRRWAAAEPDLPPLLRYLECDVAPLVLPLIRG